MPTDKPETLADTLTRLERLLRDAEAGRFAVGDQYPIDANARSEHFDRLRRAIAETKAAMADA